MLSTSLSTMGLKWTNSTRWIVCRLSSFLKYFLQTILFQKYYTEFWTGDSAFLVNCRFRFLKKSFENLTASRKNLYSSSRRNIFTRFCFQLKANPKTRAHLSQRDVTTSGFSIPENVVQVRF